MKIPLTSFVEFQKTYPKPMRNMPPYPLRFGQAWYNYFKLQAHTAANGEERALLDRIYNETDTQKAYSLIMANFIDPDA